MYGSARKSYLQILDTVHHQGLRLALGAFRTSPVTSLYVEADEPSLYLRREKLSLQYAIRLAANERNLAFKVTFSPQFLELYEHKSNALRISPVLESSNIDPYNIEKHFITDIPPWCIRKPNILFDLHTSKKTASNANIMKQNFQVLQSRYTEYQHIYRGWSGVAMVLGKLPVPGRPTIWITVGQGPTALVVGAGGGCFDVFTLNYPFLYSFSLSLGDGPI